MGKDDAIKSIQDIRSRIESIKRKIAVEESNAERLEGEVREQRDELFELLDVKSIDDAETAIEELEGDLEEERERLAEKLAEIEDVLAGKDGEE